MLGVKRKAIHLGPCKFHNKLSLVSISKRIIIFLALFLLLLDDRHDLGKPGRPIAGPCHQPISKRISWKLKERQSNEVVE